MLHSLQKIQEEMHHLVFVLPLIVGCYLHRYGAAPGSFVCNKRRRVTKVFLIFIALKVKKY